MKCVIIILLRCLQLSSSFWKKVCHTVVGFLTVTFWQIYLCINKNTLQLCVQNEYSFMACWCTSLSLKYYYYCWFNMATVHWCIINHIAYCQSCITNHIVSQHFSQYIHNHTLWEIFKSCHNTLTNLLFDN